MTGMFEITAQYSNAVLVAILPYVSDVANRLPLPVIRPVNPNHVERFVCDPRTNHFGGWLRLTNGFQFWFDHGHVRGFESSHCYFNLQNPENIPLFYGKLALSKREAVHLARNALSKLGHTMPEIMLREPLTTMPPRIGTNVVPHYKLAWHTVEPGGYSNLLAQVEVNGELKRVEQFSLVGTNFWRENPKVTVAPNRLPQNTNAHLTGGTRLDKVEPAEQAKILSVVLPEISAYASKLQLPVPGNITTKHLKDIECWKSKGDPVVQIILTNDYRFNYRKGMVAGFYSPDCFFTYDWQRAGKTSQSFYGPLPEDEEPLIKLARKALKRTGYFKDAQFLDKAPIKVGGGDLREKVGIARFLYMWVLPTKVPEAEMNKVPLIERPGACVEIDSISRAVMSVYITQRQ